MEPLPETELIVNSPDVEYMGITVPFDPTTVSIFVSSLLVTPVAVDEEGLNPAGPILTVSDDMTIVFALDESWSFTSSCMLVPSMPMDAMATTPITMPIAASIDRRKFSRTLLTERLKKISPLIMILQPSRPPA